MEEATAISLQANRRTQAMGGAPELVYEAIYFLRHAWQNNAPLCLMVAFSTAILALSFTGLALDHRQINGELAWIKPCKFGISIATYGASLIVMQRFLTTERRLFHLTTVAALAGSVLELMAIVIQALRGTASHFNAATPIDAVLWYVVKLSIMPVSLAVMVLCVLLMRQRNLPAVVGLSLKLGTALTVVGLLPAIIMVLPESAQQFLTALEVNGHAIGFVTGGPGLPVIGWSTVAGDLRVAHFVGLHALQVVPLLGWYINRRLADFALRSRLLLVWNLAAFYFAWIMLLTWQALRAESIAHPSVATIGVYGILLSVSALGAFLTLNPRRAIDVAVVGQISLRK